MAKFTVSSSFDLTAHETPGTHGLIKHIVDESIHFVRSSNHSTFHGVYVFWIRNAGGTEFPWYIGLAKETQLGAESTSKDKLRKYALAMMQRTGSPGLTFVVAKKKSGAIDRLETLLIWIAQHRNEALLNRRKVNASPSSLMRLLSDLEIPGVVNSSSGNPSTEAVRFRKMMGL